MTDSLKLLTFCVFVLLNWFNLGERRDGTLTFTINEDAIRNDCRRLVIAPMIAVTLYICFSLLLLMCMGDRPRRIHRSYARDPIFDDYATAPEYDEDNEDSTEHVD